MGDDEEEGAESFCKRLRRRGKVWREGVLEVVAVGVEMEAHSD